MTIELLRKIEASLRAVGRQERELVSLAAFELFISPAALDHLSFAVPLWPDPDDWTPHVSALKDAFRRHGKRPRLEFFRELHPRLGGALEDAGIVREMRAPVMALLMASFSAPTPPRPAPAYSGLEAQDEPFLRRYLQRQHVAYGGDADDERALDWLPNLRSGLRRGAVLGAALEQDGYPVAGAIIQIGAGTGELAGVWTDPERRRQGLAYAVCHRLLGEYAAAGYELCWLSAAEGAQRLYEKLGFVTIGTQLNYGQKRPDASGANA